MFKAPIILCVARSVARLDYMPDLIAATVAVTIPNRPCSRKRGNDCVRRKRNNGI